jgi:hypothetical protein
MNEAQINTILEQNARLLEQHQQLLALLSAKEAPVAMPRAKAPSKKERMGVSVTAWYFSIEKTLDPRLSTILKGKLIKRNLWQV